MADETMPNFWWCPTHHLYRGGIERPCADAVKLGDVEEMQKRIDMILNSVRRALDWGRDSEREALEDIRRYAQGETR